METCLKLENWQMIILALGYVTVTSFMVYAWLRNPHEPKTTYNSEESK